jgi:hypothetical protein
MTAGNAGLLYVDELTGTFVDTETLTGVAVVYEEKSIDDVADGNIATVTDDPVYTMPKIRAFRSGMNGQTEPDVTATVALGTATFEIDMTGLPNGDYDLIDVDTLTGSPPPTITGGTGSVSYATSGKAILTKTA